MMIETLNKIDYPNLRERVYKILKKSIIRQKFESGTRLVEKEIANKFAVSRTPVREAIGQLKAEGLVVAVPRRGIFVVHLSHKDIEDIYEVREVLETLAVRLAVSTLTDEEITKLRQILERYDAVLNTENYLLCFDLDREFHLQLVKISHNKKLIEIMENLEGSIQVSRWINCKERARKQMSSSEHKLILDALAKRDANLTSKMVAKHIKRVKEDLNEQLREKTLREGEGIGGPSLG